MEHMARSEPNNYSPGVTAWGPLGVIIFLQAALGHWGRVYSAPLGSDRAPAGLPLPSDILRVVLCSSDPHTECRAGTLVLSLGAMWLDELSEPQFWSHYNSPSTR
ncbi:hypothetical protein RHGRI_029504 [Rhododendron griersonianum]|uniref:Uncharacterized protein n=1 Tax=Rhododendron griersonianum TaxID=479676 RepID=A0AAV6IJL1_9ERIC|nr:hypothetical protein RHGRI_029504 [Rhododendron griersonianum]